MNIGATILVCCHKKDFWYDGVGFFPIHVGKTLANVELGIPGDDTGDNISDKNPNFCELTAQYWLWKNGIKTKYVGLNHYRRYFDFNRKKKYGYFFQNISEYKVNDKLLALPDLDKIFNCHDIIMAKPMKYPVPLDVHYSISHNKQDLFTLRNIIADLYPDYLKSYDSVMRDNKISLCNMFIMRYETFEDYSKWLFDILFALEETITIPKSPYQSRIFGFIAERLLNVYVTHNKLRIQYYPIIKISNDAPLNQIKGLIKYTLNKLAYSIIKTGSECKIHQV